jgi:diketogulonate reductase-like aldo/keto reductase
VQRTGRARRLGISNVGLDQLEAVHDQSRVKPALVQNRCFARTGWDRKVRAFCTANGIAYQGFSLLTANAREMEAPAIRRAATRTGRTPAQVVFRFALQAGMIPLTGTSRERHMRDDLAAFDFELEPAEMAAIEECGV